MAVITVYWIDIGNIKVRKKNVDENCNFDNLDKTMGGSKLWLSHNTFLMATRTGMKPVYQSWD